MKYLVVCTCGRWQLPIIKLAQSQGIICIAVDANPNAIGFKYSDYAIVSDLSHTKYIAQEISKITNEIIGAISFCSDAGIKLSQELNRFFKVDSRLIFEAENAINKVKQRQIWRDTMILQPNFEVFDKPEAALEFLRQTKLPKVIKPSDSSGSRGVSILVNQNNFDDAIKKAFAFSKHGQIIIEDYMEGTEYTVEVIAIQSKVKVLLITRKMKVDENTKTVARELVSLSPSNFLYNEISKLAENAFQALKINNGPGHLEMIVDETKGPIGVIEAAFRGGGFNLSDKLVQVATGFNLTNFILKQMLEKDVQIDNLNYRPSALFFKPTMQGKLISIQGLDVCRKIDGADIEILCEIGQYFEQADTDADRLCTIIVTADSEVDLKAKKERVESSLNFIFESGK